MSTDSSKKLTIRVRRFCQEYVKDFNGAAAAVRAGYSKRTAASQAARLLTNVNVQNYIKELQSKAKDKYHIDVQGIVDDFKSISKSNITDIFDINTKGRVVLKRIDGKQIKLSDLPRDVTKNIKSIKSTTNGIAVEMYARDGALRDLGKIAGIFIERTENVNENFDKLIEAIKNVK